MKNNNFKMWQFFYREVAKLNSLTVIYDQIFLDILDKGKRNDPFLYAILDGFTRSIATSIFKFFDSRSDSWSLYRLSKETKKIDKLKDEMDSFIYFRHKSVAHLDKNYDHRDNFDYFTKYSIEKLKIKLKDVENLLEKVAKDNNYNATYLNKYINLEDSFNGFKELYLKKEN